MTKPTSDRAQQLDRLYQLYHDAPEDNWADYLLDNGVSVDLPAEPEVKPGTFGWSTVRDALGDSGRVHGFVSKGADDEGRLHFVTEGGYQNAVDLSFVTDFVPDVVLTREIVDELIEEGTIEGLSIYEWAQGHGLA